MKFNLKVRKSDGFIKSAGFVDWKDDDIHAIVEIPSIYCLKGNLKFNDDQGRRGIKWDFKKRMIVEIPENERIKPTNPIKEQWKGLVTTADKLKFLAKIMGLED